MQQAIVAIVGRPNVGKSTFFNRLVGRTEAIVDSVSGITRDRHYGLSEWNSHIFTVIDTGGYVVGNDSFFYQSIRNQIESAIIAADIIFFMVDAFIGPIKEDYQVGEFLRKFQKPIMLITNKVDNTKILLNSVDFYRLGFNKYYCLSANNGSGSGEILDDLVKLLPTISKKEYTKNIPTIAIVGRPNAGKSTLLNTFLREERHIVTDMPCTTRDALKVYYSLFGLEFILVDTAGIRKISKINENIEYYSVMRTISSIKYADVCLLIVDAEIGWQSQDMNIYHLIYKNSKGVVIVINKWDKIEKNHSSLKEYEKKILANIAYLNDVPIIFISALMKKRILKILEISLKVFRNRRKKIKTSHLNNIMLPILKSNPPSAVKGRYITIKYCTQLPSSTPQFAFFSNMPKYIKSSYKKYIESQLRRNFDFKGVPIRIFFK
ncbi:GTP-binding protein EngA [Candidatus Uzinura diaspidicola str. ASNER]|uniref:GTPase Der n=1 Tax=Candidatus Uzinura diaspidicola str. ASNER TaxID=1133592 RepID=L7VJH4_9FLAO|nr:GTP-binding protein EngA [Candidatus Uzinura diaspidicola str. ASNER]